jgi:hypothetical protein
MDTKSSPGAGRSSDSISLIITFSIISALLIYLIYTGEIVFGSKAGNWIYPYFDPIKPISPWIPLIVMSLLGLMVFGGGKFIGSHEKMTLLACFLVAVSYQFVIREAYPVSLDLLVRSDNTNSFYSAAMRYSPIEILNQNNNLFSSLPGHARTNMPGKILLFHILNLFTGSPQMMGYLIIVLSTLGGLLLYGISKNLFYDKRTALYAFLLYVLIPAKLFFFPILNTLTPVFILLCLYLYVLFIERKKYSYLWLLGGALYILVFFEPSPLTAGIIFIGILINAIGEKKVIKKDFWSVILIPTISFFIVFMLFWVGFSFNLFQALQYMLDDAVNFNTMNRDYWTWLKDNVKEFYFAAGIPITMIFIYQTVRIFTQRNDLNRGMIKWSKENVFTLSVLVTFGVVLILGINRGEVTRLWIYLAVFFQVPASFYIAKISKSNVLFFGVASMLAIQSLITLQRVGFLMP